MTQISNNANQKIKSSLDWAAISTALTQKTVNLEYGREVRKMIDNIGKEVTELSRAEVNMRQGNSRKALELLDKINCDIEMAEEYLLVAALIGQKW
jgi:16S rRNA U516 pseudouridylate synthase RsuA-like enzyme